jgi:hypothetical protein
MNFNVNPHRTTDALPELTSVANPAAIKTPFGTPVVAHEDPVQDSVTTQIQAIQGDSLTSVLIFPESPTSAPQTNAATHSEDNLQAGILLLEDLKQRRGMGVVSEGGSKAKPLDYAMAKMTKEISSLSVEQMNKSLNELTHRLTGLGNRDQAPLTQQEISQYNAALKYFGFMTDGKNLYNLTVRIPDAATGERKPLICTRSEIEKLRSVCAVIESEFRSQPDNLNFFGPSPASLALPGLESNAPKTAASRFGIGTPDPVSDMGFGISGDAKLGPVMKVLSQLTDFKDLLAQGETFINDSAQIIERLLPEQVKVDQDLVVAIDRNDAVRTELEQQGVVLANLQALAPLLLEGSGITQAIGTEDLNTINQKLASLNLEVRRDDSGQLHFLKQGKVISQAEFRKDLREALKLQTTTVDNLNLELSQTESSVRELRDKSENLSVKIADAVSQQRHGLDLIEQAKKLGQASLRDLLALRNDPSVWNSLNQAMKDLVNSKIAEINHDLQHIDTVAERGKKLIQTTESHLASSAAIRDRAEIALKRNEALREQINNQLEQLRSVQNQTHELREATEKLETLLNKRPAPNGTELKAMADSWLHSLEQLFKEDQILHKSQNSKAENERVSLERNAQKMRENLNYHNKKLSELDEQSRTRLSNALQDSLAQARALYKL